MAWLYHVSGLIIGLVIGVSVEFYHLSPHQFLARAHSVIPWIDEPYSCVTDKECAIECLEHGHTDYECAE